MCDFYEFEINFSAFYSITNAIAVVPGIAFEVQKQAIIYE